MRRLLIAGSVVGTFLIGWLFCIEIVPTLVCSAFSGFMFWLATSESI